MSERYTILVLGDFGAREHRGLTDAAAAGSGPRKPLRVDRDDLDAAMAAIAPELHLGIESGAPPVVVRPRALDDLHPDHLVQQVAELQQLRALRSQVRSSPAAAASSPVEAAPDASAAASTASALSGGSLLDSILDAQPGGEATTIRAPRDELSKYVSQAVRKYSTPQPTVDQETLIQKIDDVVAATMRVLLHHPQFQALEALWRGVSLLARRLDTDESVALFVYDISKAEVVAAATSDDAANRRPLRTLLRGEGRPGALSLVIGAYGFTPDEVPAVAAVAAMARETGVPWISAASARFAGIASFAESADPDDWDRSPLAAWDAFRRTDDAHWVSLALPRILMRVPYGARSDECSTITFEETNDGELAHGQYLWGNPAFLCGALLGEAAGAGDELPTQGVVDGMPLHVGKVDGLAEVVPCAEVVLTQRALTELLDRGLTALTGQRDGDAVRVPRLQSCAMPPARLASPRSASE